MPTCVYPRTEKQLADAKRNLAKGREPAARAKAVKKLRKLWRDPAWRKRVSEGTRKAMHRSDVRARHLAGLAGNKRINFRGGTCCHLFGASWVRLRVPDQD